MIARRTPLSILALALAALAAPTLGAGRQGEEIGQILELAGLVEVERGSLRLHDPIHLGDTVTTPSSGSRVRMNFTDDGELWLGPLASATVNPPEERSACARPRAVVATINLQQGHIRVIHDESLENTGTEIVEVRTPTAVICLTSTSVEIRADRRRLAKDYLTYVAVRTGSVELRSPMGSTHRWGPIPLRAGNLLGLDKNGPWKPIPFKPELGFLAFAQFPQRLLGATPLEDRVLFGGTP